MKIKFWLIIVVLVVALFSTSCRQECDWPTLSHSEQSGFGCVGSLYYHSAEVLFTIFSETERETDVVVRCRATADCDLSACTVKTDYGSYALTIPETGHWVEAMATIELKRGANRVSIVGIKQIKEDILIDYLEIE